VSVLNNFVKHFIIFISYMLITSPVWADDELIQREQAAEKVAQQFVEQLSTQLKNEMKTNGPAAAIKVCREAAPAIADQLSIENGWRVSRVTTKVRNPLLGMPDQWERATLVEFEAQAAKGEEYSTMNKTAVVDEDGLFYFRYMKPLVIAPVCLNCHGSEDQIPAAVKAELEKSYPFDQAKGYKLGELRGAVSIKQPMDILLQK
jgi:methionine-rich copper-binding protein CopC